MWKPTFWKQAAERAIKTFAQTIVAMVGANSVSVLDADFLAVISASFGAAILSILTSIASTKAKDPESPSLI